MLTIAFNLLIILLILLHAHAKIFPDICFLTLVKQRKINQQISTAMLSDQQSISNAKFLFIFSYNVSFVFLKGS